MDYFSLLTDFIRAIGLFIEYVGLFIVGGSAILAMAKLPTKKYTMKDIRGSLARRIIFGLEFVIAADVLLATVATDFNQILMLGAIVVIRILLGYALRKEVKVH